MNKYDVYKFRGKDLVLVVDGGSLADAEQLLGSDDVAWAVEEHGRCDLGRWVVVAAGADKPTKLKLEDTE